MIADTANRWPLIEKRTSDFIYLRLHGDEELYASGYTDMAISNWTKRIKKLTKEKYDAYIYFDNDVKVFAPFDSHALSLKLGSLSKNWEEFGYGRKPSKFNNAKAQEIIKNFEEKL